MRILWVWLLILILPVTVMGEEVFHHDYVLEFILKREGGLNLHEPMSVGGKSYAGITQYSYQSWRRDQADMKHLPTDIEDLAGSLSHLGPMHPDHKDGSKHSGGVCLDVIKRFYYDYLERYNCWAIHRYLQLGYADFVILAGHPAIRTIQELAGVEADGVWGSKTSRAVVTLDTSIDIRSMRSGNFGWEIYLDFDYKKRVFFKSLLDRHPDRYRQGYADWIRRSDAIEAILKPILLGPNDEAGLIR